MSVAPSKTSTVPVGTGPPPVTPIVNVTAWVYVEGFTDDVTVLVVTAKPTTCTNDAELLTLLLASPEYVAVIECGEAAALSEATPRLAWNEPFTATVPSRLAPSKKLTVPVGPTPVTVAVNVT